MVTAAGDAAPAAGIGAPEIVRRIQYGVLLGTAAFYSAGYAAVGLVAMLAALVAEAIVTRRLPWRRSALDPYLGAFVGGFVLSGLLSTYRSVAIGSAVLAALSIYVSYGPLYRATSDDQRFLIPYLWTWYIGGVLAAGVAIVLFVVQHAAQATLPALGPNGLGSTLLVALILGGGMVLTTRSLLRYAAGIGVLVVAIALAFTTSRGAWLGAASGLLALLLLSWRRLWRVFLAAGVVIVVSLALMGPEAAVLKKKVVSIVSIHKNEGRVFLARSALAIAADHPLVGSGLNTFVLLHPHPSLAGERFAKKPAARATPYAHNVLLNMAAEGGLLGLGAFMAMLIRGGVAGWRWYAASSGPDRAACAAVLAAFLGLLVHQQFDGTVLSVHIGAGLWFLLAIMMVNEARVRRVRSVR